MVEAAGIEPPANRRKSSKRKKFVPEISVRRPLRPTFSAMNAIFRRPRT